MFKYIKISNDTKEKFKSIAPFIIIGIVSGLSDIYDINIFDLPIFDKFSTLVSRDNTLTSRALVNSIFGEHLAGYSVTIGGFTLWLICSLHRFLFGEKFQKGIHIVYFVKPLLNFINVLMYAIIGIMAGRLLITTISLNSYDIFQGICVVILYSLICYAINLSYQIMVLGILNKHSFVQNRFTLPVAARIEGLLGFLFITFIIILYS